MTEELRVSHTEILKHRVTQAQAYLQEQGVKPELSQEDTDLLLALCVEFHSLFQVRDARRKMREAGTFDPIRAKEYINSSQGTKPIQEAIKHGLQVETYGPEAISYLSRQVDRLQSAYQELHVRDHTTTIALAKIGLLFDQQMLEHLT